MVLRIALLGAALAACLTPTAPRRLPQPTAIAAAYLQQAQGSARPLAAPAAFVTAQVATLRARNLDSQAISDAGDALTEATLTDARLGVLAAAAAERAPIVALIEPPFQLALDAFEVAEAFEVPLQFLMTPAHHHRHAAEFEGVRRQFLSMPWQGVDAQGQPREYFIWGATAAMLRNLYRALSHPA